MISNLAKLRLIVLVMFFAAGFYVRTAEAATLYFDPQSLTAGTDGLFKVALLVDAEKPVNAFDIGLRIPKGMDIAGASDGDSVINFWIWRPVFDENSRILSFSGIVPGGFAGRGGGLAVISFKATGTGTFVLAYDPASSVMLNSPVPTPDTVDTTPLQLTIVAGKQNLDNPIPDRDPPEAFTPYVASSSAVFGGRYALYFSTQDKGSGMSDYQIAESPYPAADPRSLSWHEAESPYLLPDQILSSYIYVKAMDKAGNERIEALRPVHSGSWLGASWRGIIIACALLLALSWLLITTKSKRMPR